MINSQNLSYLNHHLKQSNIFFWKPNCKRLLFDITSTWNNHTNFTKVFWKYVSRSDIAVETFILFHISTIDSKLQCFQYKILRNTLYLNQKLFLFRKHNTSLCSFCSFYNLEDETVIRLFIHYSITKWLFCTVSL